ncbi:L,D-transpeptidase [Xenophilus aerolatus]|nr:L,D-transpeptidase [Xenophilus aerolatus]
MQLAQRAVATQDNRGHAFAVVDKKRARVHVFGGDGTLRGSSPVLLGLAKGDDSVPGIGERPMAQIRPHERTTPAGRFASEPGVNASGEDIVWVDYDAAVSMHRVRTANKADRRLERLASPTIADNRISYGCINVPAAFYDGQVKPALGSTHGVVYVMPETEAAERRFPFMRTPSAH